MSDNKKIFLDMNKEILEQQLKIYEEAKQNGIYAITIDSIIDMIKKAIRTIEIEQKLLQIPKPPIKFETDVV